MKAYSKENNTTNMEVITTQLLPGLTLKALRALGMEIHCFGKRYESAQKYLAHHIYRKANEGKLTIFIHCYDFTLFQKQLQGLSRNPMITLRMFDEKCIHSRKLTFEKDFKDDCVQELLDHAEHLQTQKATASHRNAMANWYKYSSITKRYNVSCQYLDTIKALMYDWREAEGAAKDAIVEELIALHNMSAEAYDLPTIKGRHDSKYNTLCSVDNNVYTRDSRFVDRVYDGFNDREDYSVYDDTDRIQMPLTDAEKKELMGLSAGTRRTQHDIGTLFANLTQIHYYYCAGIPMNDNYSICSNCGYPIANTKSHCKVCDAFNENLILCTSTDPEYCARLVEHYEHADCDYNDVFVSLSDMFSGDYTDNDDDIFDGLDYED